jgi:cation transport ATPase
VYYEAVGVIITLILLGRLLEVRAKAGTNEALRKLIGLQARVARVVRDGQEVEVELPGGRLFIQWGGGESSVWMTGPAIRVFAGRIAL